MNDYTEFIFVLVKINNGKNSFFLQRSYPEHMVLYNVKEEKKLHLEHEITYIEIYLQFTKNKRRKQEFICFKIILALKLIYNDNKSWKKLNIHSISICMWSADIKDVLQKYWLTL